MIPALVLGSVCLLGPVTSDADSSVPVVSTNVLTLEDSIRLALANNPELHASSGRIEAAAGRATQAGLWSNPELALSAEDLPMGGGGFSDAKKLVGVSQSVPFPGKKKLEGQAGAAGVRLAKTEYTLRRLELTRDVKCAFYKTLVAERLVEAASELVRVAESSAETARKRVAAGAAPDQEQLRAEIPMEQARTELAAYQNERLAARQTLTLLLGRPDLQEAPLAGTLAESADRTLLDQPPKQWLTTHPSMAATRTSREKAELELRRARLEPYPDVKVGVSGGEEAGRDGSIIQFGILLPLPIIDRSKGKKQEARANAAIAEADSRAMEQNLLHAWSAATNRLQMADQQAAIYRNQILPKASKALRLVQRGFEEGKFEFIDLLDTQRTATQTRLAYFQKLLELNLAQAELEALLGRQTIESNPPPAVQSIQTNP